MFDFFLLGFRCFRGRLLLLPRFGMTERKLTQATCEKLEI